MTHWGCSSFLYHPRWTGPAIPAPLGAMADTIPSRLLQNAKHTPDRFAYFVRGPSGWRGTTWRNYVNEIRAAAKALIALGFEPLHTTCILGFNRPEWTIFDLATMAAGGAPAGIYTTSSAEEVGYVIGHSESAFILVENEEQWLKVAAQREHLPKLRHVITMKGAAPIDDPLVLSWDDFLAEGEGLLDAAVDERIKALRPEDVGTLIYTSGTTGPPKGVMLTHANLSWTSRRALELAELREGDCVLSYLPLSHIAEKMFSVLGPVTAAATVYFAESLEKVPDNLKEVQPHVFFGVPRIWEKFETGVRAQLGQVKSPARRRLIDWAMNVSERTWRLREEGREPSGTLALQYRAAQRLVFSKLKPRLGLGRCRVHVSGAAPIAPETLRFFTRLDILVQEVYGQSEDCGPTSFNRREQFRFGTVGPVFPGLEVKIAPDDEILVKGPSVFKGYFKDDAATNDTLVDGWLHSGDLGAFEGDFVRIIGRKKEIIITAGGKNVTPKTIEERLKIHPLVGEAVLIGDKRKYLVALISIDPDAAATRAAERGIDAEQLLASKELRDEIQSTVDAVNKRLAKVETVKKFAILPRPLSVEHGELTATLKVKRRAVTENFAETIEDLYRD